MELKLYTDNRLAYSNKAVFSSISSVEPVAIIEPKRFNFGDMVNSSVIIDSTLLNIDLPSVTYCVLDNQKHYFVTAVKFLSGENKFQLGLLRNVWTEFNTDMVLDGLIHRGTTNGITKYRSNTIQLSQQKTNELRINDVFYNSKYRANPMWGYLFINGNGAVDSNIDIAGYNYNSTTTDNSGYYFTNWAQLSTYNYMYTTVPICVRKRTASAVYYYYEDQSAVINWSVSLQQLSITLGMPSGEIKYAPDAVAPSTNITIYVDEVTEEVIAEKLAKDTVYKVYSGEFTSTQITNNNDLSSNDLIELNNYELPNASTAEYISSETYLKYKSQYYYNESTSKYYEPVINYTANENVFEFDNISSNVFLVPQNTELTSGIEFNCSTSSTFDWGGSYIRNSFTYGIVFISYSEVADSSMVTFKGSSALQYQTTEEPYTICAIPLFDLNWRDSSGDIFTYSGSQSKKLFYTLISSLSGDSAVIADAQILPYAPTEAKSAYDIDGGDDYLIEEWLSSQLSEIPSGSSYEGAPLIVVSNPDITVTDTLYLEPYSDIQKEYTMRTYRLQSPDYNSAYDFKYYDFATRQTDGYMEFNVDITLKPFATYMHCSPKIYNESLVAVTDFDNIIGIVSGTGVFECSMNSSAFETYKRENSMYADIQERTIETLQISNEVERTNEIIGAVTSTAQNASLSALTGGGIIGSVASAGATGAVNATQVAMNDKLRDREVADSQYYYNANLATIQALPNTLNRVSQVNQDILNKFCCFVEVYDAPTEQRSIYDTFINHVNDYIETNGSIIDYISNGKYIQADVLRCNAVIFIAEQLKNDLKRGVYYYEEI